VVKVAREHGESRSQANLFFASERSRSLCRFARRRGKPPFRVGESASERRLVSLMCEGLMSEASPLCPDSHVKLTGCGWETLSLMTFSCDVDFEACKPQWLAPLLALLPPPSCTSEGGVHCPHCCIGIEDIGNVGN
jgi:hypothetical protein